MNCRHAQRAASASMDGQALGAAEASAVDAHVAGCASCQAFVDGAMRVRTAVRIRPAEPVPDLTGRIMAAAARGSFGPARRARPRRFLPAIAAAVAGCLVGSVLVGGPWASRSATASASEIARAIRAAAPSIEAFQGAYAIAEHGLSPEVPDRYLTMDVAYLAPQRFRLDVRDETVYPSADWTPTDIEYVEDMPSTYLAGPTGCPAFLGGDCSPTRETEARTRFSTAAPLPADLIAPIATFGSVDGVEVLDETSIDGHDTVHVAMSFERAAPLFPFLRLGGTWRPFFAGDDVDVWLDTTGWYPVRITVAPSVDPERRDWEMRFGLPVESPEVRLLDVALTAVSSSAPSPGTFAIAGDAGKTRDLDRARDALGYTPIVLAAPGRLSLAAVVAHEGSTTSTVVYTDGLDYVRIDEQRGWRGPQPFGPISLDAERVEIPGVGPALYEPASDGWDRRLSIHTSETDLVVDTNLSRDELLALSSSLDVRSALPVAWHRVRSGRLVIEHAPPAAVLAEAGLSSIVGNLPVGYVAASATRTIDHGRTTGITVTFRRLDTDAAGAPLTLHRGRHDPGLGVEPDQVSVALGSGRGVYAPASSTLAWNDGDHSWSLQGDLGLGELVQLATTISGPA